MLWGMSVQVMRGFLRVRVRIRVRFVSGTRLENRKRRRVFSGTGTGPMSRLAPGTPKQRECPSREGRAEGKEVRRLLPVGPSGNPSSVSGASDVQVPSGIESFGHLSELYERFLHGFRTRDEMPFSWDELKETCDRWQNRDTRNIEVVPVWPFREPLSADTHEDSRAMSKAG